MTNSHNKEDDAEYFHGTSGTQIARKHKQTGTIEYWWTGVNGRGHWAEIGMPMPRFVLRKLKLKQKT